MYIYIYIYIYVYVYIFVDTGTHKATCAFCEVELLHLERRLHLLVLFVLLRGGMDGKEKIISFVIFFRSDFSMRTQVYPYMSMFIYIYICIF